MNVPDPPIHRSPVFPLHTGASDAELARIDDIYTDVRYPGSRGLLPTAKPTGGEARELLDIAQKVFIAVCVLLEYE